VIDTSSPSGRNFPFSLKHYYTTQQTASPDAEVKGSQVCDVLNPLSSAKRIHLGFVILMGCANPNLFVS